MNIVLTESECLLEEFEFFWKVLCVRVIMRVLSHLKYNILQSVQMIFIPFLIFLKVLFLFLCQIEIK